MIGSWQQESVYVGTAVCELIAVRMLRGSFGALVFSVRIYLGIQLSIFCLLMPLSLFSGRFYVTCYILASIANFAAEICVLLGLFQELSPDASSYGSVRVWSTCTLLVSTVLGFMVLVQPPAHMSLPARIYLTMDQVFTVLRNSGLFAVFFRGLLCGSSWPRRVSYVWLGMALYSCIDFAVQRLELIHSFAFHPILQFMPPIALLIMLAFWSIALHVPRRLSLVALVPHQEKSTI